MALSKTSIASRIKANLLADADSHAVDNAALDALCSSIASAIVDEILANAVVTLGTAVAAGAMSGGPGVPVTGTGTIT